MWILTSLQGQKPETYIYISHNIDFGLEERLERWSQLLNLPVQCRVPPPGQQWRCPLFLLSDGWPSHPNHLPEPAYTWRTKFVSKHSVSHFHFLPIDKRIIIDNKTVPIDKPPFAKKDLYLIAKLHLQSRHNLNFL